MVGILILNYNNTKDIKECVDSLVQHVDLSEVKILVVDNGSRDDVYNDVGHYLKTHFNETQELQHNVVIKNLESVSYLRLAKNLGYARGNNAGFEYLYKDAEINYVMVLNSDIIITEDFIPTLKNYLKSHKNAAVVSPLLYKRNGDIDYCCARIALRKGDLLKTFSYIFGKQYAKAIDNQKILKHTSDLHNQSVIEIEMPSGSCMMFEKHILQAIGGFDPNTFLYYEENILFQKIKHLAMKCILLPWVSCIHTGGATTTQSKTAYFLKRCNYESLLYYLKTYEQCSVMELLYVRVTANLRLFRLWLGMKYKEYFRE